MQTTKRKTEEQQKQDLKKLEKWLSNLLPDEWDKYDLYAKYDPELSYSENKAAIRDDLKLLIKDLKAEAEYALSEQDRRIEESKVQAEKEVELYNNNLNYSVNEGLKKFYAPIYRAVNKVAQGFANIIFIKGRGGIGKSHNIRDALIENKADYVEVCGEVTEAYLYRLMFENNGKILWFKDVVKLLSNVGSMNLLKSATETEADRLLTKSNYSKSQDDLPDKFICRCKFIFDYNNLFGASMREDFEALISRGDFIEMSLCDEEVSEIMRVISTEDWQKEVTEFLVSNFQSNGLIRLNLRTQWKAFKTYEYAQKNSLDWKHELMNELQNTSKIRSMLYSLIGNKAVKSTDLKKMLLRHEFVNTIRTADNKINQWLFTEELFKWSEEDRNFYVCINPKPKEAIFNVQ